MIRFKSIQSAAICLGLLTWLFAQPPSLKAATFNIPNGDVQALIDAINAANASPGADTINLYAGGIYTLTAANNTTTYAGPTALPIITSQITINGYGAIIQRSKASGTPNFRLFYVSVAGDLTLNSATITGGSADVGTPGYLGGGGGLRNEGKLLLVNSTITGNAGFAGKPENANDGGGVLNFCGTLTISNSTISNNTSYGGYGGGGILNFSSNSCPATTTVINSTIFENRADAALGFQGRGDAIAAAYSPLGSVIVRNSILASPTQGLWQVCYTTPGEVASLGRNIAGDATCGLSAIGDLINTNPLLGPLSNNGGPTQTHSPLTGSPAIDAIPIADCTDAIGVSIATDQRGIARPQGASCDIGSVESAPITMFESGPFTGVYTSRGDQGVSSSQYMGWRFTLPTETHLTSLGATLYLSSGSGTLFGAIVPVSGLASFPVPPLSIESVALVSALLNPPTGYSAGSLTSASVSVTLPAGSYALIFGSGAFGATGIGAIANVDSTPSLPNVMLVGNPSSGTWANFSNQNYYFVAGVAQSVPKPALTISKSHVGSFSQGQTGTYIVRVTNGGPGPTVAGTPVTVTDTAPMGMTVTGMKGDGWMCATLPSCTRIDSLATGSSYPDVTVTVSIATNTSSPLINNASVSGGGSGTANAPGDSTTILTSVVAVPSQAVITPGTLQIAPVLTAFPLKLQVMVLDANNAGVPGVAVTFSAPGQTLPSVTFTGGATTITDLSGKASRQVTANNIPGGPYMVTATVAGVTGTFNFSLTNTAPVLNASRIVMASGGNAAGQLGTGAPSNAVFKTSTPLTVSGLTDVLAIGAGEGHSLAVKKDGTVWAWGANGGLQLGNGAGSTNTPMRVNNVPGATAVAGGAAHSLALTSDGTVWAWGNGTSTPTAVQGLPGLVVAIAAGGSHSLALNRDGTVSAWGANYNGQLGDGTTTDRAAAVPVSGLTDVIAIAAGASHSLAVTGDGSVWAWGNNHNGQLGNGTVTSGKIPARVSGLGGVIAVAAGEGHSLALMSDGAVSAWGLNVNGQFGTVVTTDSYYPVPVSNLTGVVAIAGGKNHSLAVKSDGTTWAWGSNSSGQLGNGTNLDSSLPMPLTTLRGATVVAAGSTHSLVLSIDNIPPVVIPPATSIAVEATGPSGAQVIYPNATATDNVGVTIGPTCSPLSGTTFGLGSTLVNCTAADGAGNIGTASFTVTVQDKTAPVLITPPTLVVEATGPSGATVTFQLTATDAVGITGTPTCNPASGSVFKLGTTTVTCNVADKSGNVAITNFKVTVQDSTPPSIIINSVVDGTGAVVIARTATLSTSITFTFSATDAVGIARVQCQMDDSPFADCTSPKAYTNLAPDIYHRFEVRASDVTGHVTPLGFTWQIVSVGRAIENLSITVRNMEELGVLPTGAASSMISLLKNFDVKSPNAFCKNLKGFVNEANKLQLPTKQDLLNQANAIQSGLGCAI